MKRYVLRLLFVFGLGIFLIQAVAAQARHYSLVTGEKDFYYGFISYLPEEMGGKLPEIIRPGLARPEIASLNFPLGPGDTIVTYDHPCEVQFDSGTVFRLGPESRLKIETIMAQSLSSDGQFSNLFLEKGQLFLMYTAYNQWEIFQLLTATSAIKMKNKTVLLMSVNPNGETKVAVKEGKIDLLYGPATEKLQSAKAKKGDSLLVTADHKLSLKPDLIDLTGFEAWNVELNKKFLDLHKGVTPLPKPIQKLPPAVFYFAQFYGNRYGEWTWDDYYGYVWRPFYNDYYPWGSWAPYYYGRWTYLSGQLFWVPEEPWGWVPYHLGIWQWDKKKGWIWIPGSAFAPAWAVWDFYFGYYSWRPWSLFDWLGYGYYGYYEIYGPGSSLPGQIGQPAERNILSKINKDQLKKPTGSSIPLPESYKKVVASFARALKNKDPEALSRVGVKPPEPIVVKAEDLGVIRVQEKRIPWSEFSSLMNSHKQIGGEPEAKRGNIPARNQAVFHFMRHKNQAGSEEFEGKSYTPNLNQEPERQGGTPPAGSQLIKRGQSEAVPEKTGLRLQVTTEARFRDWNPDLKVARELKIRIFYDSLSNQIVASQLGLTSREARGMGLRITPYGVVQRVRYREDGGGYGLNSSSSATSGSNDSSATATPTSNSGSSGNSGKSGGNASNAGRTKH